VHSHRSAITCLCHKTCRPTTIRQAHCGKTKGWPRPFAYRQHSTKASPAHPPPSSKQAQAGNEPHATGASRRKQVDIHPPWPSLSLPPSLLWPAPFQHPSQLEAAPSPPPCRPWLGLCPLHLAAELGNSRVWAEVAIRPSPNHTMHTQTSDYQVAQLHCQNCVQERKSCNH